MDERMLNFRSNPLVAVNGFRFQETDRLDPFEMGNHAHDVSHFCLILSGHAESKSGTETTVADPMSFSYISAQREHSTVYSTPVKAF